MGAQRAVVQVEQNAAGCRLAAPLICSLPSPAPHFHSTHAPLLLPPSASSINMPEHQAGRGTDTLPPTFALTSAATAAPPLVHRQTGASSRAISQS